MSSTLTRWFNSQIDPLTKKPLNEVAKLHPEQAAVEYPFPLFDHKQMLLETFNNSCPEKISIGENIQSKKPQNSQATIPKQIKNLVAIYSAKGGVGKSTLTHQIALLLAKHNLKVGILDADIYGPNQTDLFSHNDKPEIDEGNFVPLKHQGVYWMSMGTLTTDPSTPVIWRGPMASRALKQLLSQTKWPPLDYLLIDMPPGTGDIQLTVMKEVALASSMVITTPSPLAYFDACKGFEMMQKLDIHVGGWINNMTHITCNHCQQVQSLHTADRPLQLKQIPAQCEIPLLTGSNQDFSTPLTPFLFDFFFDLSKKENNRGRNIPKIVVQ